MYLLSLLFLACDPPPPPAPPLEGPTVPTMLGEVQGVVFTGDWTSPPCAGRKFARNIFFSPDHTFAGVDLMEPCPPDTKCMWSGIVAYAGKWKQEGTKVLIREIGGGTGTGGPHPTEVEATKDGGLLENGCVYTRGVTVPPGYTEEQVRARPPGYP